MKFKVQYVSGSRAWCYCHLHDDKIRPNLSISLENKYYGRWKCWACGCYGKLSKSKMKSLNLKEHESYDKKECSILFTGLSEEYNLKFNKLPLIQECLCKELNVNKGALNYWMIGYDGNGFTIPMYTFPNEIGGIQRRFPNGSKACMKGSQLGIFQPYYFDEDYIDTLYICEGFSDAINIYSLGFDCIGRPHCHYIKETIHYLSYCDIDNIVIIPDNDEVGIKGAESLYKEILERVTTDVYLFNFKGAKDIREWIRKVGKDEAKYKLDRYYE